MKHSAHDEHSYAILSELDGAPTATQRTLARRVGIALGLTNLLVRRLVKRGFIRIVHVKPHRVSYLLTPTGVAEKARMSQIAFHKALQRYTIARDRISAAFQRISAEHCANGACKAIVFFGSGELAEIGYICLQGTNLRLAAVVADQERHSFFGLPTYAKDSLSPALLDQHGALLVAMSTRPLDQLRVEIAAAGISRDRVVWI